MRGESMAKIKDGREHESEGSERSQGGYGDKLASRRPGLARKGREG